MHNPKHPDTELLDRLRAGLLDDRPADKAAVEQHLDECDACRASLDIWKQLDVNALGPQVGDGEIGIALRNARQRALSEASPRHRHRLVPYATAAAVLLAVVVGVWTTWPGIDTKNMMAGAEQAVPDIYEDLDFYLWLATQDENEAGNGST